MADQDLNDKRTADRLRRDMQASDAPKAWAAYQADLERTRARTAALRAERLAREAAATAGTGAAAAPAPAQRKRRSRSPA
ncbi:MAG TPA: transcriptional regulator [Hyphomicrobiales bacterium]|nr:transcriptional regulator [Hyphomicrobiales bacterium]